MGIAEESTAIGTDASGCNLLSGLTLDHLTQQELIGKALRMIPKAQGADGAASIKLEEYPNHFTMIALRQKDGGGELHEDFADIFFVVQGSATLLTGGSVQDSEIVSTGEIRGKAVVNGKATTLRQGDFAHIPAGLPHQLLVAEGETFVYFVIKVKEK
jgi:mannose-6-phosphate isomerase-like protein (cupin superfamily)